MPDTIGPQPEFNHVSEAIGQLRATTDRLQVNQDQMLSELRAISMRMSSVTEVITELREYRKTMHDRINHIHTQMGEGELEHNELKDDFKHALEEITKSFKEMGEKIINNGERIIKLEAFIDFLKTAGTILGTLLLAIFGWVSGILPEAIRHFFPGGPP